MKIEKSYDFGIFEFGKAFKIIINKDNLSDKFLSYKNIWQKELP